MGRRRKPSPPKTHPYTQDMHHAPRGVRAGPPSGLSERNLGLGSEPGSRGIALLALRTWAESCSFLGLTFLIYQMGVTSVLPTSVGRCGALRVAVERGEEGSVQELAEEEQE